MKLVIKNLQGQVISSVNEVRGEKVDILFECILEYELWVQREVLRLLNLVWTNNINYITHDSWTNPRVPPIEDDYKDTVLKIIVNKEHMYNLMLEI